MTAQTQQVGRRNPLTYRLLLTASALGFCLSVVACDTTLRSSDLSNKAPSVPRRPVMTVTTQDAQHRDESPDIVLAGAQGETLTVEFTVQLQTGSCSELRAEPPTLTGTDTTIEPAAWRLYRLHPVHPSELPGWHIKTVPVISRRSLVYDVAVPIDAPRGGLPTSLAPGQQLHMLGELRIPRRTPPGPYSGEWLFLDGGESIVTVPVRVTVYPFQLPDPGIVFLTEFERRSLTRHHVRINGAPLEDTPTSLEVVDPALARHVRDITENSIRLLQQHGLTPAVTDLRPVVRFDQAGRIEIDWADFDQRADRLLDLGADDDKRSPLLRVPFDGRFPIVIHPPNATDTSQDNLLADYLAKVDSHLADRGWLDRSYLDLPVTGPPGRQPLQSLQWLAELVHAKADDVRTVSRWYEPADPTTVHRRIVRAEIDPLIDARCPPAQFCDPRLSHDPNTQWVSLDDPPYSGTAHLAAPPTFVRVIPLQAYRYGIGVLDLGPAMDWPATIDAVTPDQCIAHDPAVWLYPGAAYGLDTPVASMRLKRLQRGIEDLQYLKLLAETGATDTAQTLLDALAPYAFADAYRNHFADARPCGWQFDTAIFDEAHRLAIEALVVKDAADDARQVQFNVAWNRLLESTSGLAIHQDGVRVQPTRVADTYRIECWVRIQNRTQTPIGGTLSLAQIPMGWTVESAGFPVSPIPPMSSQSVALIAKTNTIAWGSDGLLRVPLRFEANDGRVVDTGIRLAYFTATAAVSNITIDGDLADWPGGVANVAAGFLPISADPTREESANTASLAGRTTQCFVAHDDQHVYFAIRCNGPRAPGAGRPKGNAVTYEDMIPVGEDLIEILLDPTNAGTHAPEDLYHIVIKRNGASVFERGVGTDPPVGRRSIWPADIQYQVRESDGAWIVELRVPRDAFEQAVTGPQVWGLNFTRFDAATQTYTTWSGAVSNAYDPMSLGNLLLR